MFSPRNRMRLVASLCAALLVALAPRARAEETPAAAPGPAVPEPAAIETISPPEIVTRAEEAKDLIAHVTERNADDSAERRIESRLKETSRRLHERAARGEEMLSVSLSFEALEDLDSEWRARQARIAGWRIALTRRAQAIEIDRLKIDGELAVWQRTRDAASAASLPTPTRARVNDTIAALTRGAQTLQSQVVSILGLQNEVAQEERIATEMLERIAKQREKLGKQLFERGAPPLWSAEAYAPSGDSAFLATFRIAVAHRLDLLREFMSLSVERLRMEVVLFVVVLLALLGARRRVRASAAAQSDPALAMPTRIVERPVSAAVVTAIVTATWLTPRPPGVLGQAEALVLLVPVLRLLPKEIWSELRPGVLGLAALFVMGALIQLFSAVPSAERFLILPDTLGAIGLLYWLQRRSMSSRLTAIGRFGSAVVPVARFALLLTIGALLSNVLGLVVLAHMLMRGVLGSLYAAVAIYVLARFLSGVVTATLRGSFARRLRSVRDHGELLRRRITRTLYWVSTAAWLVVSLRLVGFEGSALAGVTGALTAKLEVGTVSVSLGNVLSFFVALWLANQTSRFVRFVLQEDVLPRIALPRGVPSAISTGVHYAILAGGAMIAIGAAGIDLSKFGLLAGALGVGLGFGLQNVVNNFVSGLILLFERPVQTGDMIEIGELQGEVKRIGIRSSTVRTLQGADVIVPNANLISERVVNWTFSDRTRRLDLEVGVEYGSDPTKVIAILVDAARATSGVLSLPEPLGLFTGFGDSSLDFQLRVWCRFEVGAMVKSALAVAVHDALRDAGITVPFPQRDVHLKVEPAPP